MTTTKTIIIIITVAILIIIHYYFISYTFLNYLKNTAFTILKLKMLTRTTEFPGQTFINHSYQTKYEE